MTANTQQPGSLSTGASRRRRVFVSTGCTSSDMLLAPVLKQLAILDPELEIEGVGGEPLRDAGVRILCDLTHVASVGLFASIFAGLRNSGDLWKAHRKIQQHLNQQAPDLVVLVDNPGLNMRILSMAKKAGIPVLFFIPPESWCVWSWDARSIARRCDRIATLFESESSAYTAAGAHAEWVGHPLIELLNGLPTAPVNVPNDPVIGLFPGSRIAEVKALLPAVLEAADRLLVQLPGAKFVLGIANETVRPFIDAELPKWRLPISTRFRQSHQLLSECHLALMCSGTATLEAAILGVPMVVLYRLSYWMDRLMRYIILPSSRYPYIALPNCLLRRQVAQEIYGSNLTPTNIVQAALPLLTDVDLRQRTIADLGSVRAQLGPPGAIRRTAELIQSMLAGAAAAPTLLPLPTKPSQPPPLWKASRSVRA